MKNLHFKDNFKNFLFDYDNFISFYENYLHVFNYKKLDKLNDKEIIIILSDKKIIIDGNNLNIKKMTKQELLISGVILKVELVYE